MIITEGVVDKKRMITIKKYIYGLENNFSFYKLYGDARENHEISNEITIRYKK